MEHKEDKAPKDADGRPKRKGVGWGGGIFVLLLVLGVMAVIVPARIDMGTREHVFPAIKLSRAILDEILRYKAVEGVWPENLEVYLPDATVRLPSNVGSVSIPRPNTVHVHFLGPRRLEDKYLVLEALEDKNGFTLKCSVPEVSGGALPAYCRGVSAPRATYVSKEQLINDR
jgi:hypothetical protein